MNKINRNKSKLIGLQIKKYLVLILLIMLTGIGTAFSLKAAVGVGAWDALIQSLSFLGALRVGTVGMILNIICIIGQILFLRKDFKWINLLQVPVSILLGSVINYFLYEVLGGFIIENYMIRLLMLVLSFIYLSIIVGAIMTLDLVTFPLEGFCMAIAKKTNISFGKIRQAADILSIGAAMLLTLILSFPLTVREGTIIAMLILGPSMSFFMPKIQLLFQKWQLVD